MNPVGNKAFAVKGDIIREWRKGIVLCDYPGSWLHNAFPAISYGVKYFRAKNERYLSYTNNVFFKVNFAANGKYLISYGV